MFFKANIDRLLRNHSILLGAIPGFIFWSLAGTAFQIPFGETFVVLFLTKISVDFFYVNLARMNHCMDKRSPKRPFLRLFCAAINSPSLGRFFNSYEDWVSEQTFLARSAIRTIDHLVFCVALLICFFGSFFDYLWMRASSSKK